MSHYQSKRSANPPITQSYNTANNHTVCGFLWTSGQLVAKTSTWQHTTLTTDIHPCPWWDSNPRSQQASGLRPRGHCDRQYETCISSLAPQSSLQQVNSDLVLPVRIAVSCLREGHPVAAFIYLCVFFSINLRDSYILLKLCWTR